MNGDNARAEEAPLFSALITPHRSLSRRGFFALMAVVLSVNVGGALFCLVAGAWPVVGFMGLDVALVYWALTTNFRRAAAYEQVIVTPSALTVRKVSHRGEIGEWSLNPLWVRLDREDMQDFGLLKLALVSSGRRLPIADCLSPAERESFATALATALAEARRGVTRTAMP
ncbi:MAG TPA: DUF2244 domain-containing protein [Xanthobacteraceae bacterium]|nr:DUF2244 domain-containing protein [Xanthobacteraceae bacterium]